MQQGLSIFMSCSYRLVLCQKNDSKGVVLVIQMQETRETVLQVRKLQWLLTSAEREDEVDPLAPARLATLNTVGQHERRYE